MGFVCWGDEGMAGCDFAGGIAVVVVVCEVGGSTC